MLNKRMVDGCDGSPFRVARIGKQEVGPRCQGKLRLVMHSSERQVLVQDFPVGREARCDGSRSQDSECRGSQESQVGGPSGGVSSSAVTTLVAPVLVSQGQRDPLSRETTEIYSHSSGGQKSRIKVLAGLVPFKTLRSGVSFLPHQLLGGPRCPWFVAAALQPLPPSSCGLSLWPP